MTFCLGFLFIYFLKYIVTPFTCMVSTEIVMDVMCFS